VPGDPGASRGKARDLLLEGVGQKIGLPPAIHRNELYLNGLNSGITLSQAAFAKAGKTAGKPAIRRSAQIA